MLNALKFKPQKSQKLSVFDIKVLFIKSVKHAKVKKKSTIFSFVTFGYTESSICGL